MLEEEHIRDSLRAIGQCPRGRESRAQLRRLIPVEAFYASVGGLRGYHKQVLSLLKSPPAPPSAYTTPPTNPLSEETVPSGLALLPSLGEIYPVGGLGSRLGLGAPAATLPFCGRSLLEGLIRDVAGREALYTRETGRPLLTPIALMTSHENDNHAHITALLETHNWFGRPKESFFLFPQVSVPVVTSDGTWVEEDEIVLQPGGHGALWHAASLAGVLDWFEAQGRHSLLIRQINNPIAGLDYGLLAFLGHAPGKTFGIAACPRLPGAAEGALILHSHLSNIEYTHYTGTGGIANTNILYAHIPSLRPHIAANPHPGLLLNLKETDSTTGLKRGRLESMMQHISDTIPPGQTFVTLHPRHKTLSVTKKLSSTSRLETPEGAFEDLLRNHRELLTTCGFTLPTHFLLFYHPALGPLYSHIARKLRGGTLAPGTLLDIETPDVDIEHLTLDGALTIHSGPCTLKNVTIRNHGITSQEPLWKKNFTTHEHVSLSGSFHAEHVTLDGSHTYHVPPDETWVLTPQGLNKLKKKDACSTIFLDV